MGFGWDTLPMNHAGTEPCWHDPQLAYDGDITTFAYTDPVPSGPWPGPAACWLVLNLEVPFVCDRFRYSFLPLLGVGHRVEVRSNGIWDWWSLGYSWQLPHWITISFSERPVSAIRWRFRNSSAAEIIMYVYEVQFWLEKLGQTHYFLA